MAWDELSKDAYEWAKFNRGGHSSTDTVLPPPAHPFPRRMNLRSLLEKGSTALRYPEYTLLYEVLKLYAASLHTARGTLPSTCPGSDY